MVSEHVVTGAGTNQRPRSAILRVLQKRGRASIKDLELALGVTATAVREQLSQLVSEGAVEAERVRGEVGRPFFVYRLTDKAQELFPKDYGTLARLLLEETLALFGAPAYEELLKRVGARLAGEFASGVEGQALGDKLYGLASLLGQKGFESEVTQSGDGFVLHASTCPYFAVVKNHPEICVMEEQMLTQILGADVHLGNCMLDGHNSCQFNVQPRGASHAMETAVGNEA